MRKLFPLEKPPHKPPQVVAAIKNDVRKYIKRERKKDLPEGVDFWDFACQAGPDRESPSPLHLAELVPAIDKAAEEAWPAIYIEILAKPGHRTAKPKTKNPKAGTPNTDREP